MFIGSRRKECRTVDCNAENVSPQKIMQMIRMNSYLHRKAALSFSTSSSDDGETRDLQDLFVQTFDYLLHVDLKNYKFHHTIASPLEGLPNLASPEGGLPKVDVLIRHDHPYTNQRKSFSPTLTRLGVSKSVPKKYMLGGDFSMCKVYEYNPSENFMKESPTIFRFLKALLVEEIGGKIYVAHAYSKYHPSPIAMEVLDPLSANPCWEELPHSPGRIFYRSHYVLGYKLYVISNDDETFYYDTVGRIWERVNHNHMFKYGFPLKSCCENILPEGGKMVSEDIAIAFGPIPIPGPYSIWDHPSSQRERLFGYLYSKDGCLLAIQDLGDVFQFHQGYLEQLQFLIAMKDGKFCALQRCGLKVKEVLAVSILSVTKLPKAAELQDKEPSRHVPPTCPEKEEEKILSMEGKFLSISIGKQYQFDITGLESTIIHGAFFA